MANRDFKYFYGDEVLPLLILTAFSQVFLVTKKGSLQFGMVIENAEFHSSDESSDEEEPAVKAGQVGWGIFSCSDRRVLEPPGSPGAGAGGLVPERRRGGGHGEEGPPGGQVAQPHLPQTSTWPQVPDARGRGQAAREGKRHTEGLLQKHQCLR